MVGQRGRLRLGGVAVVGCPGAVREWGNGMGICGEVCTGVAVADGMELRTDYVHNGRIHCR